MWRLLISALPSSLNNPALIRGAAEVRAHPFFWPKLKQNSDWKKLYARKLTPPIKPCRKTPESSTAPAGGRSTTPRTARLGKDAKRDPPSSTNEQIKQYGFQNFERSQRNLAIKSIAFPDDSTDGAVGTTFDGFVVVEGGPTIRPDDMAAIEKLMQRRKK